MDFIFEQKLTESQTFFTKQGMRKAQAEGKSFNKYQQEMISGGAGYKRLDMLADWNRGKTVFRSKKSDKMANLDRWYTNVAMPVMEQRGITPKEFYTPKDYTIPEEIEDEEAYMDWFDELEKMKDELKEQYKSAY